MLMPSECKRHYTKIALEFSKFYLNQKDFHSLINKGQSTHNSVFLSH